MCFSFGLPFGKFTQRRRLMRKYLVAAVLIGAFVAPAFALESGPYYVGFDTSAHTQDEAEKAMADMKECKGAM
jgi:hypothetical protein